MQGETEYLKRPLIDDVSYEISETRISIRSPSTYFVCCTLPPRHRKDEMLIQYKKVLQMAKAQGVKISYSRHIRRTICEQWDNYLVECEQQERLFCELREMVGTIQQRGIHMGHMDDEELMKAYEIAGEFAKLNYGDRAASTIAGFEHDLRMMERWLSDGRGQNDIIAL